MRVIHAYQHFIRNVLKQVNVYTIKQKDFKRNNPDI